MKASDSARRCLRLTDFLNSAFHIKVPLRNVVVLAIENLLETADRIRDGNLLAFVSGEYLGDAEGLAQEALNFAGSDDSELILRREFIHAKNRDDILQILVALEDFLHVARHFIVLLADNFRS